MLLERVPLLSDRLLLDLELDRLRVLASESAWMSLLKLLREPPAVFSW